MSLSEVLECTIDFEGQKLAEQLTYILLIVTSFASFVTGYLMASMQLSLYIFLAGCILTSLVVLPPWPMYNKHPQLFIQDKSSDSTKIQVKKE
ncbi:microsomal signal peptidase-like protein 12 kDa subunit [Mycotypha africana]|uniref:microsomal signal peptidase-like protein 12 kDa subunit n=1 Tax=Mycotypha africana TaxID=64632 RepID=UPI002300126D|nr:microsomal signal peptidase-like protein 12 kDa subunit [Mycotypha africana]KAI8967249.1 microsomal signal peptidase-like protein 12 kDa subunit [Mycotypha africana]